LDRERRWNIEIRNSLVLLLPRQRDFHFDLTQSFDQSLHASHPQRLD
jgi:hypothetical protein